jgi:small multidrug resistance pump
VRELDDKYYLDIVAEVGMKNYLFLLLAIICEVIGTSALKESEQFSKLLPTITVIGGYIAAFYFLSIVVKTIPIGIVYAIWSGAGIVLIILVGIVLFKQIPDIGAIIGITLIITGVIVLNVFSKMEVH